MEEPAHPLEESSNVLDVVGAPLGDSSAGEGPSRGPPEVEVPPASEAPRDDPVEDGPKDASLTLDNLSIDVAHDLDGGPDPPQEPDPLPSIRLEMADAPSEPGEEVADDPDAEAKAAIQNLELWVMRSYLLREGLFPDSFSAADPIPEPTIPFPSTTSSLLEFLSSTPSAAHLTLAQRYQLVVRETEELRDLVESERAAREAEEDELRARGDSLRAYITDLEREIREVVKADAEKDPRTGRVRNEAIAKQWEQSLRAKDATLSLLQLQNASLQSHARKLAARLSFRESTGESVRAVDFDQLRIENHLFSTRLAEMTRELLELKQRSAQPRRPSVKAAAKEAAKRKVEIEYPPLPQKAMNAAEPRHDLPSTKDFVEILKRAKQLQLKAIAVSTKPRM